MRSVALLLFLLAFAATSEAKFAATQGFSGKHGVDCGACHVATPLAADPPVSLAFEGLPAGWDANATYELRIRVSGGPTPNPVPGQPTGGFDLEVDGGTLAIPPVMAGLLRMPNDSEITYTGSGTLRRDWTVFWNAPGPDAAPRTVRLWLAGLSANGNHVMNGPDTAGERGDRYATATYAVPPSPATERGWAERPLGRPVLDPFPEIVAAREPTRLVTGRVPDDADGAEWRLDDAPWNPAIGAPGFFFNLGPMEPGAHELAVRTVLGNRTSDPTTLAFRVEEAAGASAAGPTGSSQPIAAAVMVALVLLLLTPLLLKLRR